MECSIIAPMGLNAPQEILDKASELLNRFRSLESGIDLPSVLYFDRKAEAYYIFLHTSVVGH
jgi:hypothetical protein